MGEGRKGDGKRHGEGREGARGAHTSPPLATREGVTVRYT